MGEPVYDWGASVFFDDPEMIPDYLIGKPELMEATPEATVRFNGIPVCRIVGGKLDAIACDHPRHGCHPRYEEKLARYRELMSRLREKAPSWDDSCPKCEGVGWLGTNTPEARHTVLLALMMGMWKGVAFRPRVLSASQTSDTIQELLSGQGLEGASSSPAREAAPGRALFCEGTGTGKGEGDGPE